MITPKQWSLKNSTDISAISAAFCIRNFDDDAYVSGSAICECVWGIQTILAKLCICPSLCESNCPPVLNTVHVFIYIELFFTLLRHWMTLSNYESMRASESQKCAMLGRRSLPTHPHPTNSSAFYGGLNSRGSIYRILGKSHPLFSPLFYLLPKI